MPELPEVETIARGLRPQLTGRCITGVDVRWHGSIAGDRGAVEALVGRRISAVGRRGKLLLLRLDDAPATPDACTGQMVAVPNGVADTSASLGMPVQPVQPAQTVQPDMSGQPDMPDQWVAHALCSPHVAALPAHLDPNRVALVGVHLKMTGRLFVYPPAQPPGMHTRVIVALDDGNRLFFDDARKFGYLRALTPAMLARWDFWTGLGPEPLTLPMRAFVALLAGRRARIKSLLLDQTIIAGVGNIYADESLFRAQIRPDRQAATLGDTQLAALHGHLQDVLQESIAECGSSVRDYRDAHGDAGAFQNRFRVYGRSGQRCIVCDAPLETATVAGRTSVFCPCCQK